MRNKTSKRINEKIMYSIQFCLNPHRDESLKFTVQLLFTVYGLQLYLNLWKVDLGMDLESL